MFSAALQTIAKGKGIRAFSLQRSASKIHLVTAIYANAIPYTPQERPTIGSNMTLFMG
ncbi:MAG TPA: hypothetical protein ACQGQJ_09035 [Xylella fastidiosa subsp. multiplex]